LDKAAVAKAQLDLSRTVIRSPVNGFVTNLLAQVGDYATVGQKLVSVVDTDSFWVDGYFEETRLGSIHEDDPATIKLMGYSQLVPGHVHGVAHGINVPNAQPDQTGLASGRPDPVRRRPLALTVESKEPLHPARRCHRLKSFLAVSPKMFRRARSSMKGSANNPPGRSKSQWGQSDEYINWVSAFIAFSVASSNSG
jgi:hypothetical protein